MGAITSYFAGLKSPQPTAAVPKPKVPSAPPKPTSNISSFFANVNKPAPTPVPAPAPAAPASATPAPVVTKNDPKSPTPLALGPRRVMPTKTPVIPVATISAPTPEQATNPKLFPKVTPRETAAAAETARQELKPKKGIGTIDESSPDFVRAIAQPGATAVSQSLDALNFAVEYIDKNPKVLLGPFGRVIPDKKEETKPTAPVDKELSVFKVLANESKKTAQKFSAETPEWQAASTKEKFTTRLPETIRNLAPSVAGSLIPYVVSGPAGFAVSIGSTAEDVKEKAVASGMDERQADQLALGTGVAVGLLDRLIPSKALKGEARTTFAKGLFNRIKDFAKTSLGESATEIAQENIQIAAEATFREDLGWDEIQTRNAMAGLGGLLGGAGMKTVVGMAQSLPITNIEPSAGNRTERPTEQSFVERDGEMVPIDSAPQPVTDTTPSAPEAKLEPTSNVDKLLATLAKPNEQVAQTPEPNTDLVSLAEEKAGNVQKKIVLNEPISAEVSSIVKEKSGLDVTDYEHSVSNFEVQHALNKHKSDPIPLTPQDIGLIPDIIANYDKVEHAGKTKTNLDAILYTKRYNGTTYFLEEVRTGRGELAFKTMYKNKTPTGANDALRSSPRSSRPPQAEPTPIDVSTPKLTETVSEVNQPANPKIPAQRVAPAAATAADAAVAIERRAPVEAPPAVRKITLEDTPLHNKIMSELVYAKAGERYSVPSDEPGATREFRGTKSTFPTWIPKDLRRKPLLEAVAEHITNGTIPTKAAELRLYKIVAAEMQAQNDVINDAEWVARERNNIINPLASDEENAAALAKFDEEYAKLKANQVGIPAPSGGEVSDVDGAIQAQGEQVSETRPAEPATAPVEPAKETTEKPAKTAPEEVSEPKKPKAPEKLTSAVYERLKAEDPNLTEDVTYEVQNLRENAEKAVEFIADDRTRAYRVAMGVDEPPSGMTATAINIALAEKALEDGNRTLYAQLVRQRSLEQTRRGQELVAEKGSVSDNSVARYTKELIKSRLDKLERGYLGILKPSLLRKSKNSRATAAIDNEVKKVRERIKSTKELDLEAAQSFLDSLACN